MSTISGFLPLRATTSSTQSCADRKANQSGRHCERGSVLLDDESFKPVCFSNVLRASGKGPAPGSTPRCGMLVLQGERAHRTVLQREASTDATEALSGSERKKRAPAVLVRGNTVAAVRSRDHDGRFIIDGSVEDTQCEILLDSGATASVVRASILKPGSRVRQVPETRLRAANNSFVKILGKKYCWIEIAGSRAYVDVYVAPELSSSCILGTDGLGALQVVLDFSQKKRATCGGVVVGSLSIEEVDFGEAKGDNHLRLQELVKEYADLFEKVVPGAAKDVCHRIVTTEHEPIYCRARRVPLRDQQIMEEYVQDMLKDGVISPSESPYRSSVVIVDKKDGKKRFCINYCKLNDVTIKNRYPLPRVDDLLDHTSGSKFFCVLDMSSAYWQVPLAPEDKWKTAFSTPSGHYHFNVMPFGLCNAPATQQEFMRRTFRGLQKVDVLLDDVIVHDVSISALLERLHVVFQRMRERNLKLKTSKCHLMKSSVTYLGHVISGEGQQVDGNKVEAIVKYPAPKTVSELRTFLGMSTFLKKFVKGFAVTAKPLYDLTKSGQSWRWTPECQQAFDTLKRNLMSPPVLVCPDVDRPYRLYTDASGTGMGATLCQEFDGTERVIAYASQNFNRHEFNYATIEKEAAAVLWAIKFFHPYLSGARFQSSVGSCSTEVACSTTRCDGETRTLANEAEGTSGTGGS